MKLISENIILLAATALLLVVLANANPIYDGSDSADEYQPSFEELSALLQLQPQQIKRGGWCPGGFSFSPVLRKCQPSINMLRGRSGGRIGRRRF